MFKVNNILRYNIRDLKPYSSARDEFSGSASVFLDANENPFNEPYNRYPDPLQRKLKERISGIKGVDAAKVFLGNGSDEAIDLLFRAFCEPGTDNVVSIEPSYGMYRVSADVNDISVRQALLNEDYSLNVDNVFAQINLNTKIVFLCSPNNPSANLLDEASIKKIIKQFGGLVVIDEAYIDFSPEATWLNRLDEFPNLVVLQTFSKAWGMAALRLGMAFASPEIISVFNKIKYPYNINLLTQEMAYDLLKNSDQKDAWVKEILKERDVLRMALLKVKGVVFIHPSDANFLLVKMNDANAMYEHLVTQSVIVRNRSTVKLCKDALRITVGRKEENKVLIEAMSQFGK